MAVATLEDPDYFLRHFEILCGALARYRDLLSPGELALLGSTAVLQRDALRLLVRLLSRRGSFYRISKLRYSDIKALPLAIESLFDNGFAQAGTRLSHQEAVALGLKLPALLTKDELCDILDTLARQCEPARGPSGNWHSLNYRAMSKQALCTLADAQGLWPQVWQCLGADLLFLAADIPFCTLKLLYFGNSWQEPSEFVITELGHRRYEAYPLDVANRRFDSREEIETALFCADIVAALEQPKALGEEAIEQMVLLVWQRLHSLGFSNLSDACQRRLGKVRILLGRELERRERPEQALTLYRGLLLTPARERAVRCLEALSRHGEAFEAASELYAHPLDDDELRASLRMLPRLAKKAGQSWQARPVFNPVSERIVLNRDDSGVEGLAVRYYRARGYQAWHLENGFCCGLFGLALWDIIFMPVKGGFDHPFQSAPTDMYRSEFSLARAEALAHRLDALSRGEFDIMAEHLAQKSGISNDWVNWALWSVAFPPDERGQRLATDLWQQIRPCLNGPWLASLIRYMLGSLKTRRSGWPDLLLIKDGKLSFVEVKGPGDRLQPHQLAWLQWLDGSGADASVLWVDYTDESASSD